MPGSDTRWEREGSWSFREWASWRRGLEGKELNLAKRKVDGVLDRGAEVKGRQQQAQGFDSEEVASLTGIWAGWRGPSRATACSRHSGSKPGFSPCEELKPALSIPGEPLGLSSPWSSPAPSPILAPCLETAVPQMSFCLSVSLLALLRRLSAPLSVKFLQIEPPGGRSCKLGVLCYPARLEDAAPWSGRHAMWL